MQAPTSRILGTGHFLPPIVRTNVDLESMVDTTDAWIRERTGITQRHIAPQNLVTSDMATEAAKRALEAASLRPEDIDMIIVGTVTPDMPMPATAVFVQQKLGIHGCPAFDISAACAGFVFGLSIADQFIRSGTMRHVLVIGVELLSRVVDWEDRSTCVLFGDGAGAVVVGAVERSVTDGQSGSNLPRGILAVTTHSDGVLARSLMIPAGGSELALTPEVLASKKHKVAMRGQDIFKAAVVNLYSACKESMALAGITHEDVDWVCPHQANLRILDAVTSRLGVPKEKVLSNIATVGNTSSASVPILLDQSIRAGIVRPGDIVVLCALGAGISWGGAVIRI